MLLSKESTDGYRVLASPQAVFGELHAILAFTFPGRLDVLHGRHILGTSAAH
jgi:hypothetical protein